MRSIADVTDWRRRLVATAAGGTASIVTAAVATNLLRIASSMTLTRLLDARAFGIVGIITSVAIILQLLSDIGVQPFVIRHHRGDDRAFLDEIWTLRLIRSTALTVIMASLSWPVAKFLGKPEFAPVLAVWSVNFIIDGLSSMAFATAVREQNLWRLTGLELSASVVQLCLAVALALIFRSYWALVIAMLASAVMKSILSYRLFPGSGRRWALSRERAHEMWQFSRFIAPSSMMTVFILQSDKLILARLMPLATYGLYAIAATLNAAGPALASAYGRRVLYPAYAESARTNWAGLRAVFYGKRRVVSLLYIFGVAAVGGGANLIVAMLYDVRYLPVSQFLQLLSISSSCAVINNSSEEVLIAAGNVRMTLFTNSARVAWLVAGIVVVAIFRKPILLVATMGLMEAVAMIVNWWGLRRMNLLNYREEALGVAFGVSGAVVGWGLSHASVALFP